MRIVNETARQRQYKPDPKLPPGSNFCLCNECGGFFLNVRAFDRHRTGPAADRACLPTPHMPGAGLQRDARGYWRLAKREFTGLPA